MKALEKIIGVFRRFPGVGPKQAERFALYVVRASGPEIENLVEALREVKTSVKYCGECSNYAEGDKPEFVASLVLQAIEEGQAQYFANDRLRKMAGTAAS